MQREVVAGAAVFPIERARELLAFYWRVQLERARGVTDGLRHARAGGRQARRRDHRVLLVGPAGDAETRPRADPRARQAGSRIRSRRRTTASLQRASDNLDPRERRQLPRRPASSSGFPAGLVDEVVGEFRRRHRAHDRLLHPAGGRRHRPRCGRRDRVPAPAARRTASSRRSPGASPTTAHTHVGYVKDYWSKLEPFTDGYLHERNGR